VLCSRSILAAPIGGCCTTSSIAPARRRALQSVYAAVADPAPTDDIDVGDGFLMKRGWTVAMCGWQWDVQRSRA